MAATPQSTTQTTKKQHIFNDNDGQRRTFCGRDEYDVELTDLTDRELEQAPYPPKNICCTCFKGFHAGWGLPWMDRPDRYGSGPFTDTDSLEDGE